MTAATPGQAARAAVVSLVRDLVLCESDLGDDCRRCGEHADEILAAITAQEPHAADGVPATPGQAELAALVDGHFFGDGPHPLQLVCMTEDDNDVECNTWVAEVEPGTTWNELEHRMAEHALAHHFTAAVAAQEPHAADKLAELIRSWRDSIADLEAEPMDLANTVEAETLRTVIRQLEQAAPATEQPAPGLAAERDGLRKALRAISLGIAEPSPKRVADNALDGRYFDPETDAGVWSMSDPAEQVRLARQDRDQLRTAVLSLAADLEESAARTAPSKKTDIENATAARLRKIAEPA